MRGAASWSRAKGAEKSVVRKREETLACLNFRVLKPGF
jgi:hypothetical protein